MPMKPVPRVKHFWTPHPVQVAGIEMRDVAGHGVVLGNVHFAEGDADGRMCLEEPTPFVDPVSRDLTIVIGEEHEAAPRRAGALIASDGRPGAPAGQVVESCQPVDQFLEDGGRFHIAALVDHDHPTTRRWCSRQAGQASAQIGRPVPSADHHGGVEMSGVWTVHLVLLVHGETLLHRMTVLRRWVPGPAPSTGWRGTGETGHELEDRFDVASRVVVPMGELQASLTHRPTLVVLSGKSPQRIGQG